MASWTQTLRDLDDAIDEVGRLHREARRENADDLARKLGRIESDLEDLKRQLQSLKRAAS
jgi:hypothetical protein